MLKMECEEIRPSKVIHVKEAETTRQANNATKVICRPQVSFFPIIKVIPQFFKRGFSSNKPLILKKNVIIFPNPPYVA